MAEGFITRRGGGVNDTLPQAVEYTNVVNNSNSTDLSAQISWGYPDGTLMTPNAGHLIVRKKGTDITSFKDPSAEIIADIGPNLRSYTDSNIPSAGLYYYAVFPYNDRRQIQTYISSNTTGYATVVKVAYIHEIPKRSIVVSKNQQFHFYTGYDAVYSYLTFIPDFRAAWNKWNSTQSATASSGSGSAKNIATAIRNALGLDSDQNLLNFTNEEITDIETRPSYEIFGIPSASGLFDKVSISKAWHVTDYNLEEKRAWMATEVAHDTVTGWVMRGHGMFAAAKSTIYPFWVYYKNTNGFEKFKVNPVPDSEGVYSLI